MELTGTLRHSISFTEKGNPLVTLEIEERNSAFKMVDELHDKRLTINIGEYQEKRSLDANRYYCVLLNKLSKKLKISSSFCHNMMLRRYGALEEFDGQCVYWVIPDTEEATTKADEAYTYHIKPTSQVKEGTDGLMYRTYLLLKGSHDYSRSEFKKLIEGLIDECRLQGIETATPDEIARMIALYKER